jgi:hypothetical protein
MSRSIVTSENKAEFDESKLNPSIKRAYAQDAKMAEEASEKANDHKTHSYASWAHRHASIYAHPPENVEKHLTKAKTHAAEARKLKRIAEENYLKERAENERKSNIKFNKQKGITASTDQEKRTGKFNTY